MYFLAFSFAHSEETHICWAGSFFGLKNTAHANPVDEFWWNFWSRACTQHINTVSVSFERDWKFCGDGTKRWNKDISICCSGPQERQSS